MSDDQHQSAERQSFLELTRSLTGLPLDQAAAVLETSASIAAISLRAGIEFLRAAPAAAHVLQPAELRAWGEMGRRLAMTDYESGVNFFLEGVESLRTVSPELRPPIFVLCTRQMVLSTAIGRETLRSLPSLAAEVDDDEILRAILDVATEIARRSAKHSAEFLNTGSTVSRELKSFQNAELTATALDLAGAFASRAGGIAADAWAVTPAAVAELGAADAIRLLKSTNDFLERGGGAALHVLIAGGEILRRAPERFVVCRSSSSKRGRVAGLLPVAQTHARVAVTSHWKRAAVTRHCSAAVQAWRSSRSNLYFACTSRHSPGVKSKSLHSQPFLTRHASTTAARFICLHS